MGAGVGADQRRARVGQNAPRFVGARGRAGYPEIIAGGIDDEPRGPEVRLDRREIGRRRKPGEPIERAIDPRRGDEGRIAELRVSERTGRQRPHRRAIGAEGAHEFRGLHDMHDQDERERAGKRRDAARRSLIQGSLARLKRGMSREMLKMGR